MQNSLKEKNFMDDLTTVSGCITAGDFSRAIAVAGVTMPGNQDIQTALTACQNAQEALAEAVKAALAVADGN